jgi:hypothetical protein
MPVAPFQYLETHDHSQLISFVAQTQDDPNDVPFGDRSKFFKLQPFAIAASIGWNISGPAKPSGSANWALAPALACLFSRADRFTNFREHENKTAIQPALGSLPSVALSSAGANGLLREFNCRQGECFPFPFPWGPIGEERETAGDWRGSLS